MTQIDFHLHVANKVEYVCRLLRKAVARVPVVVVVGEPQTLSQIEQQLWQLSDTSFVGHAWLQPNSSTPVEAAMQQCARVLLTAQAPAQAIEQAVLLNLGTDVIAGFEQYPRLIEVVSNADQDKAHARTRWRHYSQRGYPIVQHQHTAT